MRIGLRVDVDTFKGARYGVPRILEVLGKRGIKATFFFSVGPDNMGRNIWRLIRPAFFWKMVRTRAVSLYGLDMLFCGTFWPGRHIGKHNADVIRKCKEDGHELGLHCWDHYKCQNFGPDMDYDEFLDFFSKGVDAFVEIVGSRPVCAAVPAWKCSDTMLKVEENFGFDYCSDCHGESLFLPEIEGKILRTPQIPMTLPTYDELIGWKNVTDGNYNKVLSDMMRPEDLNVLAIHAEVEGCTRLELFESFLDISLDKGAEFCTLGSLLPDDIHTLQSSKIVRKPVYGRDGWGSWQENRQRDDR